MRMYTFGRDKLLVQDMENKDKYIPLNEYLGKFTNRADKKIEEIKIKKVTGW